MLAGELRSNSGHPGLTCMARITPAGVRHLCSNPRTHCGGLASRMRWRECCSGPVLGRRGTNKRDCTQSPATESETSEDKEGCHQFTALVHCSHPPGCCSNQGGRPCGKHGALHPHQKSKALQSRSEVDAPGLLGEVHGESPAHLAKWAVDTNDHPHACLLAPSPPDPLMTTCITRPTPSTPQPCPVPQPLTYPSPLNPALTPPPSLRSLQQLEPCLQLTQVFV